MSTVRHSAKSDGRWPPSRAGHLLLSGIFVECRGTRQSLVLPRARLYRVPGTRQSHLCRVPGTRQSHLCRVLYFCRVRHSVKYCFAECPDKKYSAKSQALGKVQFSGGDDDGSADPTVMKNLYILVNLIASVGRQSYCFVINSYDATKRL